MKKVNLCSAAEFAELLSDMDRGNLETFEQKDIPGNILVFSWGGDEYVVLPVTKADVDEIVKNPEDNARMKEGLPQ